MYKLSKSYLICGRETWPVRLWSYDLTALYKSIIIIIIFMKVEHEVKLDRQMKWAVLGCVCGSTVKEKKKSTDLGELIAFEPVILVIGGIVSRMI